MIYLDTAALVKLVHAGAESEALSAAAAAMGMTVVSPGRVDADRYLHG